MFHSNTECEIISLDEAVRSEGLPILAFEEHVVMIRYTTPECKPRQPSRLRDEELKQSFDSHHGRKMGGRLTASSATPKSNKGVFPIADELFSVVAFRFDTADNFDFFFIMFANFVTKSTSSSPRISKRQ